MRQRAVSGRTLRLRHSRPFAEHAPNAVGSTLCFPSTPVLAEATSVGSLLLRRSLSLGDGQRLPSTGEMPQRLASSGCAPHPCALRIVPNCAPGMDDGELRFATPSDLGNLGRLPLSPPTVFEAGGAAPQTQRRRRFDPLLPLPVDTRHGRYARRSGPSVKQADLGWYLGEVGDSKRGAMSETASLRQFWSPMWST
jgi:hypothetical protein